jgi:hypothetical protein
MTRTGTATADQISGRPQEEESLPLAITPDLRP